MKKEFPVLKTESIFKGRAIKLEKLLLRAPDGKTFTRELIRHIGAAVAIPVLPGEKFVLVKQHRVAVDDWLLEFPAGTLEVGEDPRDCAYRELIEEAGYRPGKLTKLVDFYPAPGISTERMYLYLATQLIPAPTNLDHDEYLKPKVVSYAELAAKVKAGKIKDGKTIVGFFYYQELKHLGKLPKL